MKPVAYDDVTRFVSAAADLAESIEQDLKAKGKVSHNTVNFLSEYKKAALALSGLFDMIEKDKVKLN